MCFLFTESTTFIDRENELLVSLKFYYSLFLNGCHRLLVKVYVFKYQRICLQPTFLREGVPFTNNLELLLNNSSELNEYGFMGDNVEMPIS